PTDAKVTIAVLGVVLLIESAILGAHNDASIVAIAPAATTSTTTATSTPTTSLTSSTTVASTTAIPPPATTPTSPPPTRSTPPSVGSMTVDALTVAPPGSGGGYNRDLFLQWIDANYDGCDTRCEVLKRQRRTDLAGLPNGGWLSAYDGYTTPNSRELDIDHV